MSKRNSLESKRQRKKSRTTRKSILDDQAIEFERLDNQTDKFYFLQRHIVTGFRILESMREEAELLKSKRKMGEK